MLWLPLGIESYKIKIIQCSSLRKCIKCFSTPSRIQNARCWKMCLQLAAMAGVFRAIVIAKVHLEGKFSRN